MIEPVALSDDVAGGSACIAFDPPLLSSVINGLWNGNSLSP
jgi:hypothetical protein